MANNNFYFGYSRNPKKRAKALSNPGGKKGGFDMDVESLNPGEFRKGIHCELHKLGAANINEASEEQKEKATETVIKNLKDVPAYYSYYEHYETTTRNMDRKPSFKTFLKELEGHSMKEIGEKFTEDKMKEIKLKESIRTEVRNKINELFKIK